MKKIITIAACIVLALNLFAVGIYIGIKLGEYSSIKDKEKYEDPEKEDQSSGNVENEINGNENDKEGNNTGEDNGDENLDENENESGDTSGDIGSSIGSEDESNDPLKEDECEHKFETAAIIKEPRCEKNGVTLLKCQRCGEEKQEESAATGHIEVKEEAIAPTCETMGKTECIYCSACGEIIVQSNSVSAVGHSLVSDGNEKQATCLAGGYIPKKYCSRCGKVFSEAGYTSPLGHEEVVIPGKAATCSESGLTDGKKCERCGMLLEEGSLIPASHKVGTNGACNSCGERFFTEGLRFVKISGSNAYMVAGYSGSSSQVTIPAEYNGYTVTVIGDSAFSGCSISSISLPSSIMKIEANAFKNCTSLSSVDMPSGLEHLGSGAFYNCKSLSSIDIPSGIDSISSNTFYGCTSLESVDLPFNIKSVGESAYYGCSSLESVSLSGVTSIGSKAFYGCIALESVDLPTSLLQVGGGAFQNCRKISDVSYGGSQDEYESISFSNSYSDPLWNGATLNASVK